jgi:hypothetical protein
MVQVVLEVLGKNGTRRKAQAAVEAVQEERLAPWAAMTVCMVAVEVVDAFGKPSYAVGIGGGSGCASHTSTPSQPSFPPLLFSLA